LARASRLVGGRGAPGSGVVVVQTRLPDHEVLRAAVSGHPGPFVAAELSLRRELSLPPFRSLAELSGPGASEFATSVGTERSELGDGRWLLSAVDHATLCDALAAAPRPRERVRVLVDPPAL
jgi:primosomal protein N'